MRKKLLTMLLALCATLCLCLGLAACGETSGETGDKTGDETGGETGGETSGSSNNGQTVSFSDAFAATANSSNVKITWAFSDYTEILEFVTYEDENYSILKISYEVPEGSDEIIIEPEEYIKWVYGDSSTTVYKYNLYDDCWYVQTSGTGTDCDSSADFIHVYLLENTEWTTVSESGRTHSGKMETLQSYYSYNSNTGVYSCELATSEDDAVEDKLNGLLYKFSYKFQDGKVSQMQTSYDGDSWTTTFEYGTANCELPN